MSNGPKGGPLQPWTRNVLGKTYPFARCRFTTLAVATSAKNNQLLSDKFVIYFLRQCAGPL